MASPRKPLFCLLPLLLPTPLLADSGLSAALDQLPRVSNFVAANVDSEEQQCARLRRALAHPSLFLSPWEDALIEPCYYSLYAADDIGSENWYDTAIPHYLNSHKLSQLNETDPARAARILHAYEAKAADGHAASMINAGCMHHAGIGTPCNHQKAMEYFLMAARSGADEQEAARYNVTYLQCSSTAYNLADSLSQLLSNAEMSNNTDHPYGEQLYLLHTNKARTARDEEQARLALERLMPRDGTGSCHYVAALCHHFEWMGMPQDDAKALELYHAAAEMATTENGYAPAQLMLGNIYFFGLLGQEQDVEKALSYYAKAAAKTNNGNASPANHRARTALAVWALLCGQVNATLCTQPSGENRSEESFTPMQALIDAANYGDGAAAYNLGVLRLAMNYGLMSPLFLNDIGRAAYCKQPDMRAAAQLYSALHDPSSRVRPEDIAELMHNDSPAARVLLANCYATGTGLPRDTTKALLLYIELQDQHPAARYNLGVCYEMGIGVMPDAARAAQLKAQASEELYKAIPR